jgi:alpha-N-arabinofuranosidase
MHSPEHLNGRGQYAPAINEEVYNLEDALVIAGFLNSFINHADCVKIANIAQIVNVIAPILTRGDDMLIQSIFYPFAMFSRRKDGIALRKVVTGPTYAGGTNGTVHYIDTSAILGDGKLHVFTTNRSLDECADVDVVLSDGELNSLVSGEILAGDDPNAANSFEQPDLVKAHPFADVEFTGGIASFRMPPLSVAALTLSIG